jgi:DNA adenine methylase
MPSDWAKEMMDGFRSPGRHKRTGDPLYLRGPLAWPGGKFRSIKHILPLLPYRNGWVDCFGGGGAVTAARQESRLEVFNDRHSGVTAFFRVLRNPALRELLAERILLTPFGPEEFAHCRDTWQRTDIDDLERAARFWSMHCMSFGKQGLHYGRTLDGRGDAFTRLKGRLKDFHELGKRFQNIFVENLDFRTILRMYDRPDTVFYLDPPFLECERNHYTHSMTLAEHAEMLDIVFSMRAFVAVSHFDHPTYRRYPWDSEHSWQVRYTMNGITDGEDRGGRETRTEYLYIKEATP